MVLISVAVTAVVVALVVVGVMRRWIRRRLETTESAHRMTVAAHAAAVTEARTTLQQSEAALSLALEQERAARSDDVDALLKKLSHGMKWEQTSREIIRREATAAGIDGALMTNLFLLTADVADAPFVTQIDHLLVTRTAMIAIEVKHWRGVVFDDVDPASLHPALAPVTAGIELPASFAIQFHREKDGLLGADVRRSPRAQVRAQALHLSRVLGTAHEEVPWIQTCVLYSHPDVHLFAAEGEASRGHLHTPAVDAARLGRFLRTGLRGSGTRANDVSALVSSVAPHAADVVGLGAMSADWPDTLQPAIRNDRPRRPS